MRKSTRFLPAFGLVVASTIGAGSAAFAVPITYTEIAKTASGSLGGVAFSNQPIVLTMKNDTANVTGGPGPFAPFTNKGTITLTVGASPTVMFSNPDLHVFADQVTLTAGFVDDVVGNDILDVTSSDFSAYDLTTAIGPVAGPSAISPDFRFPTTGGTFILTSAGPATFAATTTAPPPVPEPASLTLLGAGLAGLGLILVRSKHGTR